MKTPEEIPLRWYLCTGSLECALGLTNVLGRAEEVSLSAELGMNNLTEFSISVSKPRLRGRPRNLTAGVYQKRRSFREYSSYSEETRGGTASIFRCADTGENPA